MARKDLLLDTAGNLVIEEGDFVIESSDMQHIKHIVEAQKGEFKEFPFMGSKINIIEKGNKIIKPLNWLHWFEKTII